MKNEIILYQSNELTQHIEVRIDEETVWLTQDQMASLFGRNRVAITQHIGNIFKEGELDKEVVCKDFLLTTQHGAVKGKTQTRKIKIYNLDVIISVGYRVKSKQGTQFRIWANKVLKDYLLKGYSLNNRMNRIEDNVQKLTEKVEGIDLQIQANLPPNQGIFFNGQVFDAYIFVSDLIRSAKKSIILIDNYIDDTVLTHFAKRKKDVDFYIFTKKYRIFWVLLLCIVVSNSISVFAGDVQSGNPESRSVSYRKEAIIIDHNCTDISKIPVRWIDKARKQFMVWYGHTSHGSQITSGMRAMNKGAFRFNSTGKDGALFYQETGGDLGHRGDLRWMQKTKDKLDSPGNTINVVMWSWCGGCSDNTEEGINLYLQAVTELESEYPDVIFVYMTGHLDGSGVNGNLNKRNNQIRKYCKKHKKVLFDFADIESFDPDGNSFLQLNANDGCFYDKDKDGRRDGNWCDEWIAKHPDHEIELPGHAAHTRPLNGALKGRAFWWMMARLAGWENY